MKIRPVEYVHMDHTDHLGFQYFCDFDLICFIKISMFWKMTLFQISVKMSLFCGGKFSDRVSSKLLAVSAAGPPAAFFQEIDMSGLFGHAHFGKKCVFAQIWSDLVYLNLEILKDQAFWYGT